MTENEKTTALIPSVGADGGQPPHNSTNQSIPHETCESNPPEENIEEMRERIRRMNDPRYLHTVSMTELYQTAYKSRPPVIDGLLYSGHISSQEHPKSENHFW
ncbi:MAG: hypothetical protein ACLS3C_00305 [Oscillospiraceae bacterium]